MKTKSQAALTVWSLSLAGTILCLGAAAPAQNLFEADYGSGNIYEITTNGVKSTFASGLNLPEGLAFDGSGNLYEADGGSGNIYKFTTNGVKSTFASGLNLPNGLAFDSNGNLYEADYGSGNIYKFTTNGVQSTFASGLSGPDGLAFDSKGNLYEADRGSGHVYKFTAGSAQSTFGYGLSFPLDLKFNNAGDLFVVDQGDGTVTEFTTNGVQSTAASGISDAQRLAIDSAGNIFVASGGTTILEFTPGGTPGEFTTFVSGLNDPEGLVFQGPPPSIINEPTNAYALVGSNVTINVLVSGGLPLSFQWYFSNTNFQTQAGAYALLTSGFVLQTVVTNGGSDYTTPPNVHFIGGGGSSAGGVAVVSNGMVVAINMTNAGNSYQEAPAVQIDPPNGLLIGETTATLNLGAVGTNNFGNYFVVVANSYGSATSSVASLTLPFPTITIQPQDALVEAHGSNSFTVTAAGAPALSYQWLFNGTNLPDALDATLTISNITQLNLGLYSVIVTNTYGSATSSAAHLDMYPYLAIPFGGLSTYWGYTNTLSVDAWGTALSYQWYFNGQPIAGGNSSTLPLGAIQFTNAGLYTVVVSSPFGSVTNTPEQVVVNPAGLSFGLAPELYLTGTVGYTYIIQKTINLANTNWVTVTNLTLTTPAEIWVDTSVDATLPAHHFYRVLPGQ